MPRGPEVPAEYLYTKLKDWQIFDSKEKLIKMTDQTWEEIRKLLKLKMSTSSLYLCVYKNCHRCREKLEKYFKITSKKNNPKKVTSDDEGYQPDLQLKPKIHTVNCPVISFDITLPMNQIIDSWSEKKLISDLRNLVRRTILDAQHIPCPFSFPNAYITADEHLKISGKCSECESEIFGTGQQTDEENFQINIRCLATQSIIHKRKYKLSSNRRKKNKTRYISNDSN